MGQMERSASAMPMISHPPEEFENDAMILGTLRRTVEPNVCLNYPLAGPGRVSPGIGGLRGLWVSFANAEKILDEALTFPYIL